MNWSNFETEVLAMSGTDEAKVFMLGIGLAFMVRAIRAGLTWLKKVNQDVGE